MRIVVLFVVFVLASLAVPAAAAPSSQQLEAAKSRYEAGKKLYDAGDYDGAIREYRASYQLSKRALLLFNIAQSHRLSGKKSEAISSYREFIDADPDSPYASEARKWIDVLSRELEAESAKQAEQVAQGSGNGSMLPGEDPGPGNPGPANLGPGNPGPGNPGPGNPGPANLGPGNPGPAIPGPGNPGPKESTRSAIVTPGTESPESRPEPLGTLAWAGIGTTGLGVVLVGVGVYFGVDAHRRENRINENRSQWTKSLLDDFDRGRDAQRYMYISGGIGAALIVTGTALFVADRLRDRSESHHGELAVLPTASDRGAGMTASWRF